MRNMITVEHPLLDTLREKHELTSDFALAVKLGVAPPVISKTRRGQLPVGSSIILRIHETFGMPVKEIRHLATA